MSTQTMIFHAFAAMITICSLMVIASRNPVTSAVFLIGDLFLLAGLYAMMDAHFAAAIQVLVYAGAVVVLFMFVIMLLNQGPAQREALRIPPAEIGVLVITVIGFAVIGVMLYSGMPPAATGEYTPEAVVAGGGNTFVIGMVLFTKYLWPFELASILILLAIVACIVIAKKEKPEPPAPKGRLAHGGR